MIALTVGELKAQFSHVISQVQLGEDVGVLYGKAKKPVAVITQKPLLEKNNKEKRKLGIYENKASYSENANFKISVEEFLGL